MAAKLIPCITLCLVVVVDLSTAYKLDVLAPGNRRREFYDTACEDHEGPRNPLDISGCDHFFCNDNTRQPIDPGTPCKRIMSFGHCLNGRCLTPQEYLEKTSRDSASNEGK
ncbi:uncharacterized protein LOC100898319 [Galendromus occidentalis]|uniref:Uncharacterized protein LOC100898319 n=1 Tax=Galendromus occidentalis TaxID=34638 RepID=A0AAJ6VY68_9ACAR|nr:uncharacterized protein LOC100898319 [Galendromus occidentalis]